MTWLEELVSKALSDEYLIELIDKLELKYAHYFLLKKNDVQLTDKEYDDILRYADILCRDANADGRNKSYKILSLLFDFYHDDKQYRYFANAILTKLGNFASLNLAVNNAKEVDNIETAFEKEIKRTYQQVPNSEFIFTDPQYKLFEALKDSNHFSFSGPTSFGKSFIMDAFIHHIITERKGIDNIVILVPTRALINQVSSRLKEAITENHYKVLSHPIVPAIYRDKDYKYIFVFTPERLISYLAEKKNPVISYMFIDEAQKIVSDKDSRAPLYYNAILLAERKSIKLYFASPNIPNTDIFLRLFEKSIDEQMVVKESPVAQNRFYIDYIEQTGRMFTESGKDVFIDEIGRKKGNGYVTRLLNELGTGCKNIVYCNTIDDTVHFALNYAKALPEKNDARIDSVIELIQKYVHKEYYLIDCLKKGVAFHFGRLPQRIRERIEKLFEEKALDYIFCTSTLLEGVNLPAKNIFIFNNAIGNTKFSDIDFWNLAGRAGRLSKELSGNIICVRIEEKKNRWDTPDKDLEVIRKKNISAIDPLVVSGKKNFYKNLEKSLTLKAFTKKNASQTEKDIWNHYANIVFTHQVSKTDSVLTSNFITKNETGKRVLLQLEKNNKIPPYILEQCSGIKVKYQNDVYENMEVGKPAFPLEVTVTNCKEILDIIYDQYNWKEEESSGRNPMVRKRERLDYWAVLMYTWIKSTPLNMIITNLINYYKKKGEIWNQSEMLKFDAENKELINLVINNLIADIDNCLRFKIKNYFQNYYLIAYEKNGEQIAGENWGEYLEYGTTDLYTIELQNIGLPRHLALMIKEQFSDYLKFEDGKLVDIDLESIKRGMDTEKNKDEIIELHKIIL